MISFPLFLEFWLDLQRFCLNLRWYGLEMLLGIHAIWKMEVLIYIKCIIPFKLKNLQTKIYVTRFSDLYFLVLLQSNEIFFLVISCANYFFISSNLTFWVIRCHWDNHSLYMMKCYALKLNVASCYQGNMKTNTTGKEAVPWFAV